MAATPDYSRDPVRQFNASADDSTTSNQEDEEGLISEEEDYERSISSSDTDRDEGTGASNRRGETKTLEERIKDVEDKTIAIKARLSQQARKLAPPELEENLGPPPYPEHIVKLIQDTNMARAQFLQQYLPDMRRPDDKVCERVSTWHRNFLHMAVVDDWAKKPYYSWLVKELAKDCPALLCERELHSYGPSTLFKAVSAGRIDFIKAVLASGMNSAELSRAIEVPDSDHMNCIHSAIKQSLDEEVTIKLIEASKPSTLGSQDNVHFTPLHYAVEYERCTPSRLKLVTFLIKRSDAAFDVRSGKSDQLSVYRHHFDSRKRYEKELERKAAKRLEKMQERKKKKRQNLAKDGTMGSISEGKHRDGRKDGASSKEAGKGNKGREAERNPLERKGQEADRMRKAEHPGSLNRTMSSDLNNGSASSPVIRGKASLSSEQPKLSERSSRKASPSRSKESPSEKVADEIAKELKLHYLRSTFNQKRAESRDENLANDESVGGSRKDFRNHNTAVAFLYGDNKDDKQICFEFPATVLKEPKTVDFRDFMNSYGNWKFDEALQYVEFRQMKVENLPMTKSKRNSASQDLGIGRHDVVYFFNWLSKKSVTNIIKVTVEDKNGPNGVPHSDGAVEKALEKFNVEILDWQKVDLDPLAIRNACKGSDLRELHLWWSGNNGMLRAWSEPDGLVKIKTLQVIYLHETRGNLESSDRTDRNLNEFRRRLEKNRAPELEPIEFRHDKPDDESEVKPKRQKNLEGNDKKNRIDTHRWLSVMDRFATGIANLEPPERFAESFLTDPSLPPELRKDIRVALIDDGVNFMHKAIASNLEIGKSFDSAYEDEDMGGPREPFHGSTTGHGTCMAYMIRRVCPLVKIYACKLNVIRGKGDDKASFTAKSAADAVEYAVDRGFDIISISWTIQLQTDGKHNNSDHLERLRKSLKRAGEKGALVFCSAPDIGMSTKDELKVYYPFGCSDLSSCVFRIGAARADGGTYNWTGSEDNVSYILPGHKVEPRESDKIAEENDAPRTGSSVATALAAGLAALIIQIVRLGAIYNFYSGKQDPTSVNEETVRAIKRFQAMKQAFITVSARNDEKNQKDKNLRVENFFKAPGDFINDDSHRFSDEEKWTQVVKMARDLVSSSTQSEWSGC